MSKELGYISEFEIYYEQDYYKFDINDNGVFVVPLSYQNIDDLSISPATDEELHNIGVEILRLGVPWIPLEVTHRGIAVYNLLLENGFIDVPKGENKQ